MIFLEEDSHFSKRNAEGRREGGEKLYWIDALEEQNLHDKKIPV